MINERFSSQRRLGDRGKGISGKPTKCSIFIDTASTHSNRMLIMAFSRGADSNRKHPFTASISYLFRDNGSNSDTHFNPLML